MVLQVFSLRKLKTFSALWPVCILACGYIKVCHPQSQLSVEKMEEFFHFWSDDFKFEDRAIGCALQCMSHHFNLLTASSRMHHENTNEFIKSFPNGKESFKYLCLKLI